MESKIVYQSIAKVFISSEEFTYFEKSNFNKKILYI